MKHFFRRTTSLILIVALLNTISLFALSVSAIDNNVTIKSTDNEKLSKELFEKLNTANNSDKFDVWIWFEKHSSIENQVDDLIQNDIGLSYNDIFVDYTSVNNYFDFSSKTIDNDKIKSYISSVKNSMLIEKDNVNKYLLSKRRILSSYYNEFNDNILTELNISDNKIKFISTLTPSIIANLSKSEILILSHSNLVTNILCYDVTNYQEPICEKQQSVMCVDNVKQQYSLTGNGVNVLMFDHGYIRSDTECYDLITNPDRIKIIRNKNIYSTTQIEMLPKSTETHPNFIAAELQEYSPDVNIFSVSINNLDDVEWALLNCNINLINASANCGTSKKYSDDMIIYQ